MPYQEYVKLYCPVCKQYFGGRYIDQKIEVYCPDCRATYTFLPYLKKPLATLDKDHKPKCGCGRCGR